MSTRAIVATATRNGKIVMNVVNYDGYPEHLGKILYRDASLTRRTAKRDQIVDKFTGPDGLEIQTISSGFAVEYDDRHTDSKFAGKMFANEKRALVYFEKLMRGGIAEYTYYLDETGEWIIVYNHRGQVHASDLEEYFEDHHIRV